MSQNLWLTGLIPAAFTPMRADGSLNLKQIAPVVEQLLAENISGLYVCGSTGEGVSMNIKERQNTLDAYLAAVNGRVPVIAQVGHNSLNEAKALAAHAQQAGATAISAIPPTYFGLSSFDILLACLHEITSAAPELPFYYYHIPQRTGIEIDVVQLLQEGIEKLPTLVGLKYSTYKIYEVQACVMLENGRFNVLYGSDEMLFSGLSGGAHGAVGTTYNFAAPLFNRIIAAFEAGDIKEAQIQQGLAVQMVSTIAPLGGLAAFKAVMQLIDRDCGPTRLPLAPLNHSQIEDLQIALQAIGFFEWR